MSDDAMIAVLAGTLLIAFAATTAWSLALRFRRRELQHREWMAALEKGMPLPDLARLEGPMTAPRVYLLKGLVWLFAGAALSVFLIAFWWTSWDRPPVASLVRDAQNLRELGYSQQEIRGLLPFDPGPRPDFPVGLCLLGLVPAGVGFAYLAFYRTELKGSR
jgi:hypothetical protein